MRFGRFGLKKDAATVRPVSASEAERAFQIRIDPRTSDLVSRLALLSDGRHSTPAVLDNRSLTKLRLALRKLRVRTPDQARAVSDFARAEVRETDPLRAERVALSDPGQTSPSLSWDPRVADPLTLPEAAG